MNILIKYDVPLQIKSAAVRKKLKIYKQKNHNTSIIIVVAVWRLSAFNDVLDDLENALIGVFLILEKKRAFTVFPVK